MFFNGCMELHVDEIIIIHLDVVKQHVRFIVADFMFDFRLNGITLTK